MTGVPDREAVRLRLAVELCEALDGAGVRYGILHGAEDYPRRVGRDLDVLLSRDAIPDAVAVIRDAGSARGWESVVAPISWAGAPVIFWKEAAGELHTFEFHFIDRIVWAGVVLWAADEQAVRRDPEHGLQVDVRGGFAKRVLTQVLSGAWTRMAERMDEVTVQEKERTEISPFLETLFGARRAGFLRAALEAGDLEALRGMAGGLRSSVMSRALVPFSGVGFSPGWLVEKFQRWRGFAGWYLPNLVVLADDEKTAEDILKKSVAMLSFSKAMTIPAGRRERLPKRERLRIRQHRGLFRFAVLSAREDRREDVTRRLGNAGERAGNLFVRVSSGEKECRIDADFQLGKERAGLSLQTRGDEVPLRISTLFFRAVRATADGLHHFNRT